MPLSHVESLLDQDLDAWKGNAISPGGVGYMLETAYCPTGTVGEALKLYTFLVTRLGYSWTLTDHELSEPPIQFLQASRSSDLSPRGAY